MVQRKPTPEEQLLKLIENSGTAAEKPKADLPASAQTKKGAEKKGGGFKFPDLSKIVSGLGSKPSSNAAAVAAPPRFKIALSIKVFNRYLLALVVASVLYLLFDLIFFKPSRADFLSQVSTADPLYPKAADAVRPAVDVNFYRDAANKRNPFLPPNTAPASSEADAAQGGPGAAAPEAPSQPDIIKDFKLVGISWGEEPLAMIEDTTTGRTYFLRKNQEVREMKIQAISKDKVTVSYKGSEGELM